ncbi:unnamed protein product [Acanthoscelides obtectus]|nr:unnamed protein product [Acanthoscelides obtectus]CAK1639551.1 Protein phosphatase 1 regulatory subunit 3B [Acanthoscelides obtectus]
MTEPSNVPPLWMSFHFLEEVTRGVDADPGAGAEDRWQITFAQPASDYVKFRTRLDEEKVSLENVIIKESDDALIGTVKVKNIAFEKEVFIRSSINNWQTHEDTFCSYVPNSSATPGVNVLYDTFSFKMPLPPRTKKVEFCVCYRSNGTEYWDNNIGKNYAVLKKMPVQLNKSLSADDIYAKRDFVGNTTAQPKYRSSSMRTQCRQSWILGQNSPVGTI